jgi:uncharacterized membrane protein
MSDQGGDNPYEAPAATLTQPAGGPRGGSIEATLDGRAVLEFGDVLSEAWNRTKGIKTIVLVALIGWILAFALVVGVLAASGALDPQGTGGNLLIQLITAVLGYPLFAGVAMVAVRQSVGAPVEFAQVLMYYGRIATFAALGILISIITSLGYLLLILPGVYLSIATVLAVPLCADKDMGIMNSLTTSLKLVNKEFLTVFLLMIAIVVISILSFVTIIGWIWGIPMISMVMAIMYRQLAGVSSVH